MKASLNSEHPLSRREQKKQEKRERIRQAALDLFRRKGFTATKVEEITTVAGVAKGTFFNYFSTKEAIILDLGERELARVPMRTATSAASARDRMLILLQALAEGVEGDRELIRQAMTEAMRLPDLFSAERSRFSLRAMLSLLIAQGQRTGEFRQALAADAVAQALDALCYQQMYVWATAPEPEPLAERLEEALDLLVSGIGGPTEASRE